MFAPYQQYGGWAACCHEVQHDGKFDKKTQTLSYQALRVLQTLDQWNKPFAEFVTFYEKHQTEIHYLCSPTWPSSMFARTKNNLSHAFYLACKRGHLACAQWLHKTWPNAELGSFVDRSFRRACVQGDLQVAKWLAHTWPEITPHTYDDYAFVVACRNGHVKLVQWLINMWPSVKNLDNYNQAFDDACRHGYLEVAQWCISTWPTVNAMPYCVMNPNKMYTFECPYLGCDIYCYHTYNIHPVFIALRSGNITVANWILHTFPQVKKLKFWQDQYHEICCSGHLESLKWIHANFNITPIFYKLLGQYSEPIRQKTLEEMYQCKYLHIAKWIHSTFPNRRPYFHYKKVDLPTLNWLKTTNLEFTFHSENILSTK